tara:strand:- start:75 stop:1244 length:1170 start_codon:yes stop_codon:yes gene_type:complete
MKKIILSILMSFIFTACEEDASAVDEVVGVWYMPQSLNRVTAGRSADQLGGSSLNAWNYSMVITTNSDQNFVDQMSEADGSVNVSGFINGELKFMQGYFDNYNNASNVFVTNYNWMSMFQGSELNNNSFISLSLNNYPQGVNIDQPGDSGYFDYNDDHFTAYTNDGVYFEVSQDIDYNYDGKTLTVPAQQLVDSRDSTLTITGTLTHSTIDIPANTSTEIMSYDGDISWDYGSWAIHIKEDGKWVEVYTFEEQQNPSGWSNVYVDSTVAEWEMKDDMIVVTYRYDDVWPDAGGGPGIGQGTWLYQVAYTYEIENDNLKLLNEFNMCEFEEDYCLEMFEGQYGLDYGSLDEIKMVWELEFSKTPNLRKAKKYQYLIQKSLARHSKFSIKK